MSFSLREEKRRAERVGGKKEIRREKEREREREKGRGGEGEGESCCARLEI